MDRIFLDANVLFSAAYRPNAGLTQLWRLKKVELITSLYAVAEARINLTDEGQLPRLQKLLRRVRIVSEVAPLPRDVELPGKDQPILQAAIHSHATHLLTGDRRHFGAYFGRRIGGVLILPPAEYFAHRRKRL